MTIYIDNYCVSITDNTINQLSCIFSVCL